MSRINLTGYSIDDLRALQKQIEAEMERRDPSLKALRQAVLNAARAR